MRFEIAKEVFDLLPNGYFGVVAVKGMDNTKELPELTAMLQENIQVCEKDFEGVKVKNAEDIVPYREAFKAIGINPNRYMCSIEALLDRIAKGKGFPHINAIVDMGNAVSIKYHLPIGAHDIATIDEALEVRYTKPGDTFIPFGGGEEDNLKRAKSSTFPWRTGENQTLDGGRVKSARLQRTPAAFCSLSTDFTDLNKDKVEEAAGELAQLQKSSSALRLQVGFIDKDNRVFQVE